MMPRDPRKLLDGYATGSLTGEERARLFQAALHDQALFDALADEDALRELLADPEARAKVLAALAEPAPPKPIPFHRRMPVLGAAASIFLALTAGLAYWRTQGKQPLKQRREGPTEPQAAPAPPPAQMLPTPALGKAPQRMTPAPKPAPLRDELLRAAPENLPAPSKPDAVDAVLDRTEKKRGEDAAKALPVLPYALSDEAPAGARKEKDREEQASRSLAVPSSAVSGKAPSEAQKTEAYHRAWEAKKSRADVGGDGGVSGSVSAGAAAGVVAMKETQPPPVWTYERLEDGRGRLRVLWSQGHLILLLREGSTAKALASSTERLASDGRREAVFLIPKGDAALDLYLLEQVPADPAALPANGPIQGFRHRIRSSGP